MITGYAPDSVRLGEHDLSSSSDCEDVNVWLIEKILVFIIQIGAKNKYLLSVIRANVLIPFRI